MQAKPIRFIVAVGLIVAMTSTLCALEIDRTETDKTPPPKVAAAAAAINQFTFDVFQTVGREQDGNLMLSPMSISTALAMTYAGAEGATQTQMAKTLHFTMPEEQLHRQFGELLIDVNARNPDEYELRVANRLWGRQRLRFLPEFLETNRQQYQAPLAELDFAGDPEGARETINHWVEDQTNQRIKDLIPKGMITSRTPLVLTNAVYFNGDWANAFDEQFTEDRPFIVSPDRRVDVATMHQMGTFEYASCEDFQTLRLPYQGDDLSMLVLLPTEVDGLAELEQSLTSQRLDECLDQLCTRSVSVYLPKFEMESSFKLKDALVEMGMDLAFSDSANFSDMTGRPDLKIADVLHKTYVGVDETGTEAAAATAVIMIVISTSCNPSPPPPVLFRADHPFLFMIRDDRTDSILFIGRVAEPSSTSDTASIPEPSTVTLLGVGLLCLMVIRFRSD